MPHPVLLPALLAIVPIAGLAALWFLAGLLPYAKEHKTPTLTEAPREF